MLREEKLFEIKVHGLPRRKKRELEATLRDFAAGLEESTAASSQQNKSAKHVNRAQRSSNSHSKHGSSSSHSRPVDSAYASMSTGLSSGSNAPASLGRPSLSQAKSTEQRVERYLHEIPEGLYPRDMMLTDKERKKWVVRRLERLFTGKMSGSSHSNQRMAAPGSQKPSVGTGPELSSNEACREAQILPQETAKKTMSRDNKCASNCNGENESGGIDTCSGNGSGGDNDSAPSPLLPVQRPTRPRDLDPDRVQVPSDNMEYIRHLGVTAPDYLSDTKFETQDASIDADGWIHLNLLCSLAQLHIINVTPDYIRSAVSEKSAKFQLSRDGRKIRWRGGTEGTKFSGDSSGDNSRRSPNDGEESDGSNENGQRKKQRVSKLESAVPIRLDRSKTSTSSDSFHYKPMFLHRSSSNDTSQDDTGSQMSYGVVENSNLGKKSRSTLLSGSGSSDQKRRRVDGAIVYYNGAPFCTDLSGDPAGDCSPIAYMAAEREQENEQSVSARPLPVRSMSGSSLAYRPLSDGPSAMPDRMNIDTGQQTEFISGETELSDYDDAEFPWCDERDTYETKCLEATLEPCGLGGVLPEDHFALMVVTKHPINVDGGAKSNGPPTLAKKDSADTTGSIVDRISAAAISRNPPRAPSQCPRTGDRIQYEQVQQLYRDLKPPPLPPPAMFFPPFTSSSSSSCDDRLSEEEDDEEETTESREAISRVPGTNEFAMVGNFSTSSDDDKETDNDMDIGANKMVSKVSFAPVARRSSQGIQRTRSASTGLRGASAEALVGVGSSVATAGGEESGYSSGREED